ncbi:MAG TPA: T9SS type A sorting domain-containing protein [Bacteroidia bacterium]|nr:T9SS type A sorting domain-containing protein [Bacteroidia bacterium]
MIKNLLTALLLSPVIFFSSSAQNLVLNGGLDNYIICPGFGQFSSAYINNWTKPSIASTDYYNTNCTGIQPVNQVPHSGEAYFGIIAYNFSGEYREYATGQLSSTLTAGVQYTVEFYVSLNDGYIQAVNELGAYLSTAVPGPFSNTLHISVTPQIENTTLLGSDSTWMLISGTFVAAGGEQYITIGNFNDDANTTVTQVGNVGSYGAYYFVDDVSVMELPTGINLIEKESVSVFPNPATNFITITNNQTKELSITIFSSIGEVVHRTTLMKDAATAINLSGLAAGIYLVTAQSDKNFTARKIIKE